MADDKTTKMPEQPTTDAGPGKETPPEPEKTPTPPEAEKKTDQQATSPQVSVYDFAIIMKESRGTGGSFRRGKACPGKNGENGKAAEAPKKAAGKQEKPKEPEQPNRRFYADRPNAKWFTDVTEFHYYAGPTMHKLYLSAILDLCDRRIVSFAIRDTNDAALCTARWIQALETNPGVHPMLHSDRGNAYTTQIFHDKLTAAGITQSMSRVGKCTDNGPMEGFWGILKRERYYGRRFTSRAELVKMIREYITYYNFRRLQRKLGVRTPMEVHDCLSAA